MLDPALKFVLFIPNFEVKTSDARTVVPASFSRQEVVENLGNASLIAAAFASGKYEHLRGAFVDRLHQPFREKFVPFLPKLLRAAADAGALGGFLSGSGSTVACRYSRGWPERLPPRSKRLHPKSVQKS